MYFLLPAGTLGPRLCAFWRDTASQYFDNVTQTGRATITRKKDSDKNA
jgi:hypothetical protein